MTVDEVHAAFNDWLANRTGVANVIQAHSDAPRPAKPYVMTNLMLSAPIYQEESAYDYTVADEGTPEETITQHPIREWYWRFSVHAYGDDAMATLRKVLVARDVRTYHDLLRPLDIHEISALRNVPEMTENAVERRANCDIELRGVVRDGLVIDVIEDAPVTFTRV